MQGCAAEEISVFRVLRLLTTKNGVLSFFNASSGTYKEAKYINGKLVFAPVGTFGIYSTGQTGQTGITN
jgi:hypothetical protein